MATAIVARKAEPRPSHIYPTYWKFAAERQAVFFRRLRGLAPPWSEDPIVARYKFTNAYRASDRVSQFMIRHVVYEGDQQPTELFFRVMLFKIFNRIETWRLLEDTFGRPSWQEYTFGEYDRVLAQARTGGDAIYSAAYIMPSPPLGHARKHQNHLRLLEKMMAEDLPTRLTDCRSMEAAFRLLRSYPGLGDFLAYQYLIDLNYSSMLNFSEMDFVVAGPGARGGLSKCFLTLGDYTESEVIQWMAENQEAEVERLGLQFEDLFGRGLQLIDTQNLFCEVDKYARVAHPDVPGQSGRTRIKQTYMPHADPVPYWYPPKWKLTVLLK